MSTRLLLILLSTAMLTLPAAEAFASFGGKIRNIRVLQRTSSGGYDVTASTPGGEVDAIDHIEFQFEDSFEGPAPQENPIVLERTGTGWEVLAVPSEEIPPGLEWELSLTPLADDGAPAGESAYFNGDLGGDLL